MVRIDQAADPHQFAFLERFDSRADLDDPADNFVARHAGVGGGHDAAPLIAHRMEVGVAYAAEEDLYPHILIGCVAALNRVGGERLDGAGC